MGILAWIVFGVVAGSIANRVMPGPAAGGIMVGIIVGIVGGLLGGLIGTLSTGDTSNAFDFRSLLMAVIGTMILLFSYRCLAMRQSEQKVPSGNIR